MFLGMFLTPKQNREAEQRRAANALSRKRDFDEFPKVKPRMNHDIAIRGETFRPENPMDEIFPHATEKAIYHPSRELRYMKKALPVGIGLQINAANDLYSDCNRAYFDIPMQIPVLHFKERESWTVWMSLTPYEVWTQWSGIAAATGDVVVGGLGMGWMLRQIAKKPTVKSITVVEKDQRILDWYGTKLCENTPKVKDVICSDIYAVAPKFDVKKTRFILDIWPEWNDAEFDAELKKLRATGAKVWGWGSARAPLERGW